MGWGVGGRLPGGWGVRGKDPPPQGHCCFPLSENDRDLKTSPLLRTGPEIATISFRGSSFGKRESREGLEEEATFDFTTRHGLLRPPGIRCGKVASD